MAATKAQVQQFAATNTPAAKVAAARLHIPWPWVLAQWAHETGYGTQPHMGAHNLGNILSTTHTPINFPSEAAFINSYVASTKADFPNLTTGHTPVTAFGGRQSYSPNTPNYGAGVQGALQTLQTWAPAHVPANVNYAGAQTLMPNGLPGSAANNEAVLLNTEKALGINPLTGQQSTPSTVLGSVTGHNPAQPPANWAQSSGGLFGPLLAWLQSAGLYVAGGVCILVGLVLLVISDRGVQAGPVKIGGDK